MKTKVRIFSICVSFVSLLVILVGCGHNIVTYVDGQEVSLAGIIVYRNGKVLQSNVKENSNVNLESKSKNDTTVEQSSNTESFVNLTLTTGEQVTGYRVDLEKERNGGNNE